MLPAPLKKLFSSLNAQYDVPLAPLSTLKIGGKGKYFIEVQTKDDLKLLSLAIYEYGLKTYFLSGGSNTLFLDEGFDGLIIKLGKPFSYISTLYDHEKFAVGSATPYALITKRFLALGAKTALGWLGTPGLVGGALRMNAGNLQGAIGDVVTSVTGYINGDKIVLTQEDLQFKYRKSSIPNNMIISETELTAPKKLDCSTKTLECAQEIRKKRRLTQPRQASLGSTFKNPLPHYAGQLIEEVGLKGFSQGDAQFSPLHANFITNNGNAKSAEVMFLIRLAQKRIHENFGIKIQPEIKFVEDKP